jgi:hypothetical protein
VAKVALTASSALVALGICPAALAKSLQVLSQKSAAKIRLQILKQKRLSTTMRIATDASSMLSTPFGFLESGLDFLLVFMIFFLTSY